MTDLLSEYRANCSTQEEHMPRWEYMDVWWKGMLNAGWEVNGRRVSGLPNVMTHQMLNEWGADGWELVAVLGKETGDGYRWVFKRQV
jgi:hypothetical protein